ILPRMEQEQTQERQTALIESIRQGDGTIAVDVSDSDGEVDYYDDGAQAPVEEAALFAPLMEVPTASDTPEATTVDTGVVGGIGILTISSIDLELPVIEGVSSAQLKISVGHVPQTATIGDTGNAVIAGHRSYTYGEHFNRLGEVAVGDEIRYLSITGEEMTFVVDEILEIVPGDQSAFAQPEDKSQITLYTCTPIRTATHRLLVRASRVN
ncbi:class D sortase, partial [Christensenellaceae bacterium OttesenSCG-928-M15]|nr:class D sortase [Christensenellaceae bacterium OttesenSCG-928-M15]